jgi:hypothetical protein
MHKMYVKIEVLVKHSVQKYHVVIGTMISVGQMLIIIDVILINFNYHIHFSTFYELNFH